MTAPLSTWAPVDPELLRARAANLTVKSEHRQVMAIVDGCYACLGKFHGIDFVELERDIVKHTPRELWRTVEDALARTWLAIEELLAAMQPLSNQHQARVDASEAAAKNVLGESEINAFMEAKGAIGPHAPMERIEETAWAMAFVLGGEIEGFRRRLPAVLKAPDGWELVSSMQDHVGHLSSAVNAIVTGVYSSLPSRSGEEAVDDQSLELVSAQELRSRVFKLRDGVLALEESMQRRQPQKWQPIVQEVHRLLEEFVFSHAFAWMRAGDKRAFLKHRQDIGEILSLWSPLRSGPARHAVGGLGRHLEALEVINRRECLVLHDREALRRVITSLTAAQSADKGLARESVAKAVSALALVQGRDKELDELLSRALDPSAAAPMQAILARAEVVLGHLG